MAEEQDPDRMARFRLLLPKEPLEDDTLHMTVDFLDIRINVRWRHSQHHELINLLKPEYADPLLRKASLEFLTALGAAQVDADLGALFPEGESE